MINDSSLSDPPIHIVMTLRFMVTLSIGSPTRDSTRRYSLGHPKRLCCEVPAVHQGTGQGPDPKPRPKEEARGGHTCHGQPALWVLNHSDARVPCPLCPAAFVCSSSPSCSIQQPQDDLPSPAQAPKAPLRPAVKGQPARAASYRLISRPPFLQAWQQKKRGGPGPTGSLRPPAHKRAGDKDIFWDGRCWCRIPPGAWEAGERLGWVSWAGHGLRAGRLSRTTRPQPATYHPQRSPWPISTSAVASCKHDHLPPSLPTPSCPPGPTKRGLLRAVWSPLPSPRGLRVVLGSHVHTRSFNLVTTECACSWTLQVSPGHTERLSGHL